jgi:diadenosine tetraphosphate (Ap4A) HIT family hydrolase
VDEPYSDTTHGVECDICVELFHKQGPVLPLLEVQGIHSRVIARSATSTAIVGLGAITPGYLLILPDRHCLSVANLTSAETSDLARLKESLRPRLEQLYGNAVFFEHGSVTLDACAGSCIPHAHLHALPCMHDFRSDLRMVGIESRIADLKELKDFARSGISYFFFEDEISHMYAYPLQKPVLSQFLRKIWARHEGCPDEYDWAVFPGLDNMVQTIDDFGRGNV